MEKEETQPVYKSKQELAKLTIESPIKLLVFQKDTTEAVEHIFLLDQRQMKHVN